MVNSAVRRPIRADARAASSPACPAPTTITSNRYGSSRVIAAPARPVALNSTPRPRRRFLSYRYSSMKRKLNGVRPPPNRLAAPRRLRLTWSREAQRPDESTHATTPTERGRNAMAETRKGEVTFKGNPVELVGPKLKAGDPAPDF